MHPIDALLHNQPERDRSRARALYPRLRGRYDALAVAYADCGSYGAIDEVLAAHGISRLRATTATTCSRATRSARRSSEEPGTYFLTDFLARTFEHTVVRELGLDRHPELRDDYFRNYTRVLWLAQRPTPATRAAAQRAAERIGLPLYERAVGNAGLERQLEALVTTPARPASRRSEPTR